MNDMDPKTMRKRVGSTGWMALLYYILLNVCVIIFVMGETMVRSMEYIIQGDFDGIYDAAMEAAASGWGYLLATAIGFAILMLWKKRKFWREQIWKKGKPMKFCDFMAILAIFLCGQLVYQIYVIALEVGLNIFGLTMTEGIQAMTLDSDNLSMFLYMAVAAPIAEEILCRGLIQRTLMPFGKGFAIFASAFLFGMFHGNILQAPMAFLVGLVLGYVAAEYSIAWAMILHMINNMVLGDMLTRLIPNEVAASITLWIVLVICFIGAVIVLVRRGDEVTAWKNSAVSVPGVYKRFFSSGGVITFTILMVLSMVATCFSIITPM